MKDKLHKNHHRGIHYRVKAFFLVFVVFASAIAIAIIPTYIVISDSIEKTTKAEPEVVEVVEEDQPEESDPDQALSYQR